jgi:ACS family glucarate transporter-like MFS transporter
MKSSGQFRWVLVGWLFVLSAIAYLDRVNISVSGQMMSAEYGLDQWKLGLLSSFLLFGYAIFQAPAGRMADRLGPRITLTGGLICWALFSALVVIIPVAAYAFPLLVLARFGLGAGEAVMYPASNRIVSAWIPVRERGLANGVIFTGVGIGFGITPPIIAGITAGYGWRASFMACAVIGAIAGLAWFALARDTPSADPAVSEKERAYIRAGIPASAAAPALSWHIIARDRNVRLLTMSYFCYGYTAWIFLAWFYTYLNKVRGMDLRASVTYGMLPGLAMALGSALGGVLNDRLSRSHGRRWGRCGVAAVGIAMAAAFIALGTQVADARLASMVLAGGAGALYLAQSSFWSVTADIAGSSAGSVSGVMNMGAQFGGMVTASLSPWIAQHFGWTSSFLVAAVLCIVAAATWLAVRPDEDIAGVPSPPLCYLPRI